MILTPVERREETGQPYYMLATEDGRWQEGERSRGRLGVGRGGKSRMRRRIRS
jgi:hypothetical protein